jgi:hypothetical protein
LVTDFSRWGNPARISSEGAAMRRFPKTAKPPRVFLDIQILEERTPVSEQIGTLVGLSWLSQAAWPAPAPEETQPARPALDKWTTADPGGVNPAEKIVLVPAVQETSDPAARPAPVWFAPVETGAGAYSGQPFRPGSLCGYIR